MSFGEAHEEIRILFVGKSGSGKSASANTIAGENLFVSQVTSQPVNTTCKHVIVNRFDTKIMIIDTQGYFDTTRTKQDLLEEMSELFAISSPGPHAVVCVIPFGRLTEEDMNSINLIKLAFGEEVLKFTLVLFTRLDNLDEDEVTVEEYIRNSRMELKTFLRQCDNRHVEFNNKADKQTKEKYAKLLFDHVRSMKKANQNNYFKNENYQNTEARAKDKTNKMKTCLGNSHQWHDDSKIREEIGKDDEENRVFEFDRCAVNVILSSWPVNGLRKLFYLVYRKLLMYYETYVDSQG